MQPLRINNYGRPSCYRQMVRDCSSNIRLSGREASLLCYYADCATGFAPALAEVTKQTGISSNKVSEIRKSLADKNLITLSGRGISLAWLRIRALAMIPPLTKRDSLSGVWQAKVRVPHETLGELADSIHDPDALRRTFVMPPVHSFSEGERTFLKILSSMTATEYYDWLSLPVPKPRMMTERANAA